MRRFAEYEVVKELAEAGTGRLFVADRKIASGADQRCVVKVFHDRFRRNGFFRETLFGEAPAAIRFRHTVAVPHFDVDDRDGRLFLAMERVHGVPWSQVLERSERTGRSLSVQAVLHVGLEVARMLEMAHQHPGGPGREDGLWVGRLGAPSVLITPQGEIRVLGVGFGRSVTTLPASRPRLPYQAPELFLRKPPSPETDVYGLALLVVEGLIGGPWLRLGPREDAKSAVLNATLPPLPRAPASVITLLRAMLSKDPLRRPADLGRIASIFEENLDKAQNSRVAEWAQTVKLLFPDMSGGPDSDSSDLPPLRPRVSVPYSRSPSGVRRPANARPQAAGPPTELGHDNPSSYDIEDLANLLASGDLDANQTVEAEVYEGDPKDSVQTNGRAPILEGLVDSANDFDVDSVVDAIFGSGAPQPKPPLDSPPKTAQKPAPRRPSSEGAFPPFDDESFPSEPPTRHGIGELSPAAPPGSEPQSSPWSPAESGPPPTAMPWGARFIMEADGQAKGPEVEAGGSSPDEDEDTDPSELLPGQVIQDRYRIVDEIGRGGMSIVYRAEHTLLLQEVAVKLLRPELSMLKNVVERFHREARSVCRLDDPNIVRVTDFGRTDDGLLYLVMNLIDGESLSDLLERRGPLPPRQAFQLVDQVLSALEHAHKHDIVHRDLKPENIMLVDRDGQPMVKILDFGIAKLGRSDQMSITQAGTVFGTPRYMSPEQAAGEPVDHRTDLYTVGVILYQLLTGRVPFDGDSTVQLLAKVLTQDPPPIEVQLPAHLAEQLEAVVQQALAKEPEERFADARAFRRALEDCLL